MMHGTESKKTFVIFETADVGREREKHSVEFEFS